MKNVLMKDDAVPLTKEDKLECNEAYIKYLQNIQLINRLLATGHTYDGVHLALYLSNGETPERETVMFYINQLFKRRKGDK